MDINEASIGALIGAIGGLGMAAFALVDCSKIGRLGGVSNSGFAVIESAIKILDPNTNSLDSKKIKEAQPLSESLLQILHAHWINGMAIADQKAIAKSLIKLRLTPDTAKNLAGVTAVDMDALTEVAKRMTTGQPLEATHTNALGRFDLAVTAILDAAYQRADQLYRNASKAWASGIAVILAIVGGLIVDDAISVSHFFLYLLCGILAVPLAPVSKDLTSALSAGVKIAQTLRR
jgi:hypothetical protein